MSATKSSSQIGLDIGSAAIKLVELAPSGANKWRLLTAASITKAEVTISEQNQLASLAAVIIKMVREAQVKSRRVVASLPQDKVSTHQLEIPFLADNEIGPALTWQVEQYIPLPLDQVEWDWQVVKKDKAAGQMEVLLVAVAKTLAESYRHLLETAGLEPVALETELMAAARSTVAVGSPLAVVVDIGAKGTDIGLVRDGMVVFSRTLPTAGEAFTRSLETALGLESSQAESYKNTYGFSPSQLQGKLLAAMRPVLEVIVTEVKKTLDFYTGKHPGEVVKSMILSGGVAALPDIVSALSARLGLEVVIANPFARVEVDAHQAQALKGQEPFYAVAVGLAQRND